MKSFQLCLTLVLWGVVASAPAKLPETLTVLTAPHTGHNYEEQGKTVPNIHLNKLTKCSLEDCDEDLKDSGSEISSSVIQFPEYEDHEHAEAEQVEEVQAQPMPYEFTYSIRDGTQSVYSHRQEKQEEAGPLTGSYSYLRPDGVYMTVKYIADKDGYRAEVLENDQPPEQIMPEQEQRVEATVTLPGTLPFQWSVTDKELQEYIRQAAEFESQHETGKNVQSAGFISQQNTKHTFQTTQQQQQQTQPQLQAAHQQSFTNQQIQFSKNEGDTHTLKVTEGASAQPALKPQLINTQHTFSSASSQFQNTKESHEAQALNTEIHGGNQQSLSSEFHKTKQQATGAHFQNFKDQQHTLNIDIRGSGEQNFNVKTTNHNEVSKNNNIKLDTNSAKHDSQQQTISNADQIKATQHVFNKVDQIKATPQHTFTNVDQIKGTNLHVFSNADKIKATQQHVFTNVDQIKTIEQNVFNNAEQIKATPQHTFTNTDQLKGTQQHIFTKADQIKATQEDTLSNADQIKAIQQQALTNTDQIKGTKLHVFSNSNQIKGTQQHTFSNAAEIKGAQQNTVTNADQIKGSQQHIFSNADQVKFTQQHTVSNADQIASTQQQGSAPHLKVGQTSLAAANGGSQFEFGQNLDKFQQVSAQGENIQNLQDNQQTTQFGQKIEGHTVTKTHNIKLESNRNTAQFNEVKKQKPLQESVPEFSSQEGSTLTNQKQDFQFTFSKEKEVPVHTNENQGAIEHKLVQENAQFTSHVKDNKFSAHLQQPEQQSVTNDQRETNPLTNTENLQFTDHNNAVFVRVDPAQLEQLLETQYDGPFFVLLDQQQIQPINDQFTSPFFRQPAAHFNPVILPHQHLIRVPSSPLIFTESSPGFLPEDGFQYIFHPGGFRAIEADEKERNIETMADNTFELQNKNFASETSNQDDLAFQEELVRDGIPVRIRRVQNEHDVQS